MLIGELMVAVVVFFIFVVIFGGAASTVRNAIAVAKSDGGNAGNGNAGNGNAGEKQFYSTTEKPVRRYSWSGWSGFRRRRYSWSGYRRRRWYWSSFKKGAKYTTRSKQENPVEKSAGNESGENPEHDQVKAEAIGNPEVPPQPPKDSTPEVPPQPPRGKDWDKIMSEVLHTIASRTLRAWKKVVCLVVMLLLCNMGILPTPKQIYLDLVPAHPVVRVENDLEVLADLVKKKMSAPPWARGILGIRFSHRASRVEEEIQRLDPKDRRDATRLLEKLREINEKL